MKAKSESSGDNSRGSTPSYRGPWLFVNKDASNIKTKHRKAAVSTASSHVQGHYAKWKKLERTKQLQASARLSTMPFRSGTSEGSAAAEEDESHAQEIKTSYSTPSEDIRETRSISWTPETDAAFTPNSFRDRSWSPAASEQNQLVETPPPAFKGNSDPFDVAAVQITPGVNELMEYTRHVLIPSAFPEHFRSKLFSLVMQRCWDEMTAVTQDDCSFNSHLAVAASAMVTTHGMHRMAPKALVFKCRSMAAFRASLTTSEALVNPYSFHIILRFLWVEIIEQNREAARVHLKMLQTMVGLSGGLANLDAWLAEMIAIADLYFAYIYLARPLFPALQWSLGPLSAVWRRKINSNIQPNGETTGQFPQDHPLQNIFNNLTELLRVREYLSLHETSPEDPIFRWVRLQKPHLTSQLLRYYHETRAESSDNPSQDNIWSHGLQSWDVPRYVCVAAIYWVDLVFGHPGRIHVGINLLDSLQEEIMLDEQQDATTSSHAEFRLWALFVGAFGEAKAARIGQTRTWHTAHFLMQAMEMNLFTVHDLRERVERYLYSEMYQGKFLTGLVMDVGEDFSFEQGRWKGGVGGLGGYFHVAANGDDSLTPGAIGENALSRYVFGQGEVDAINGSRSLGRCVTFVQE